MKKQNNLTIHEAAAQGDLDRLKELIDLGIDVNEFDKDDTNPLMSAIVDMQPKCIEYLLENGADPFLSNRYDADSFMVVAMLLEHVNNKIEKCKKIQDIYKSLIPKARQNLKEKK